MGATYYGNWAGPGPSYFRVVQQWETRNQGESGADVYCRNYIEVASGSSFGGTYVNTNFGHGADAATLYGAGTYADTGWFHKGWTSYGSSRSDYADASYTSWSGAWNESDKSSSYYPDVPKWKPSAPTGVSASVSGTSATVRWTRNPTTTRPWEATCVERYYDGAWHEVKVLWDSSTSWTCTGLAKNASHAFRVRAYNSAAYSDYSSTVYASVAPDAPAAPTSCSVSRTSDTSAKVTWTDNPTTTAPYSSLSLERRVNGGAWSALATLSATATAYTDSTTAANCSYAYRVRAYNASGWSGYATSGTTYNTPAAPSSFTKLARTGDTNIEAALDNSAAATATALQVQRKASGGSWEDVATVSGGNVSSFSDNPGGGTFYYRARNTRGSLASAWCESGAVVTICAPAAPTPTSPASSVVVEKSEASVAFSWVHNPIDGSAQTACQLRWSVDGGSSWTTVSGGSAQSMTLANSWALNATVSWQVRTKGVHADYSPWSPVRSFSVYQVPQVWFDAPAMGFVIEDTPVSFSLGYSDPSGSMRSCRLSVTASDGSEAYSRKIAAGGAMSFSVSSSEWLPSDGEAYSMTATVQSTTTLQASASRSVTVDFELPAIAMLDASVDRASGTVRMCVREAARGEDEAAMDHAAIWRVNPDGSRVLVADDLADGQEVVDEWAPLNADYSYETASFANSGAVSQASYAGRIDSECALIYHEGGIASARLAPEDSIALTPSFELVEVAGEEFPVAVFEDRTSEVHAMGARLRTREEAWEFYRMGRSHAPCVYKSLYGQVFRCVCVPTMTPQLQERTHTWAVSVQITRIAGGEL